LGGQARKSLVNQREPGKSHKNEQLNKEYLQGNYMTKSVSASRGADQKITCSEITARKPNVKDN